MPIVPRHADIEIIELFYSVPMSVPVSVRYERTSQDSWIKLDYFEDTCVKKKEINDVSARVEIQDRTKSGWRIKKVMTKEHLKVLENTVKRLFPGQKFFVTLPPNFPIGEYTVGHLKNRVNISYGDEPGKFFMKIDQR